MQKTYTSPRLVEYGSLLELTLGSTGSQGDFIFSGGVLRVDPNNSTCTNNVPGSGICVRIVP